jgi:hypothetical protein
MLSEQESQRLENEIAKLNGRKIEVKYVEHIEVVEVKKK